MGRLLVVAAGLDHPGRLEQILGDHEVLGVAHYLVRKDLAVVTGRVGGDLDPVQAALDQPGNGVMATPEDLERVHVLDPAGDLIVVLAPDRRQHLVGLLAVLGHLERVTRLLVDRVTG